MTLPGLSSLGRWRVESAFCQSIRLLSAVGVSAVAAWLINLQEPGWALITSVIVTQNSITDTISKGRDQLVGTLIGASVSVIPITLMMFLHWPLWWAFALAFVPLVVLVSFKPEARMGIVTLMIAILFPTDDSPYMRPIERVLAIMIGVSASTLVTYVVLHEQARRDAFRSAAVTVRQILAMLQKARAGHVEWSVIQDMNDECAASLRLVHAALEEARREHWVPLEERDPMLARLPMACGSCRWMRWWWRAPCSACLIAGWRCPRSPPPRCGRACCGGFSGSSSVVRAKPWPVRVRITGLRRK